LKKMGIKSDVVTKLPDVVHIGFVSGGGGDASKYAIPILADAGEDDNGNKNGGTTTDASGSSIHLVVGGKGPNLTMTTHEGEERVNMNEHFCQVFREIYNLTAPGEVSGNNHRRKSYQECIRVLSRLPETVTHISQVKGKGYAGFGDSNLAKLHEMLTSDDPSNPSCQKLRELLNDSSFRGIALFRQCWGIGTSRATTLYNEYGCRTIEDVRRLDQDHPTLFDKMTKIGLKYFEEINEPVPKDEMRRIFATVERFAQKIEANAEALLCGSARRQDERDSSDIDVLLIVPTPARELDLQGRDNNDKDWDFTTETRVLKELVDSLELAGIITDHGSGMGMKGPNYMGVCVDPFLGVDARHRRIDIKVYPSALRAFGHMHFTGNTMFNRAINVYAQRYKTPDAPYGLKMSKLGLFKRSGAFDRHGESVQCGRVSGIETEEDIFKALSLQYRKPTERFGPDDMLPIEGSLAAAAAVAEVQAMRDEDLVGANPEIDHPDEAEETAAATVGAAGLKRSRKIEDGGGSVDEADGEETLPTPPLCSCLLVTVRRKVRKDTPNQGKFFYGCSQKFERDGGCGFFQLEEDVIVSATHAQLSTQGDTQQPPGLHESAGGGSLGLEGAATKLPFSAYALSPTVSRHGSPPRIDDFDGGGQGEASSSSTSSSSSGSDQKKNISNFQTSTCWACGGRGHWSSSCPKRRRK